MSRRRLREGFGLGFMHAAKGERGEGMRRKSRLAEDRWCRGRMIVAHSSSSSSGNGIVSVGSRESRSGEMASNEANVDRVGVKWPDGRESGE